MKTPMLVIMRPATAQPATAPGDENLELPPLELLPGVFPVGEANPLELVPVAPVVVVLMCETSVVAIALEGEIDDVVVAIAPEGEIEDAHAESPEQTKIKLEASTGSPQTFG